MHIRCTFFPLGAVHRCEPQEWASNPREPSTARSSLVLSACKWKYHLKVGRDRVKDKQKGSAWDPWLGGLLWQGGCLGLVSAQKTPGAESDPAALSLFLTFILIFGRGINLLLFNFVLMPLTADLVNSISVHNSKRWVQ